jgi:hypothetical protein
MLAFIKYHFNLFTAATRMAMIPIKESWWPFMDGDDTNKGKI